MKHDIEKDELYFKKDTALQKKKVKKNETREFQSFNSY